MQIDYCNYHSGMENWRKATDLCNPLISRLSHSSRNRLYWDTHVYVLMMKGLKRALELWWKEDTHFTAGVCPHMLCTESIEKFLMRWSNERLTWGICEPLDVSLVLLNSVQTGLLMCTELQHGAFWLHPPLLLYSAAFHFPSMHLHVGVIIRL